VSPVQRKQNSILVVNDDPASLASRVALLREAGHVASGVTSCEGARSAQAACRHDLVVTDLLVGRSSGLQLLMGLRRRCAETCFILITDCSDLLLDMEARRVGAVLQKPSIRPAEFLAVVAEQLAAIGRRQRWPRKPVTAHVMLQVAGRPGRLVNVSYGGLRFDVRAPQVDLPSRLAVRLPTLGVSVEAELIWTARDQNDAFWQCGAAILPADSQATRAWRAMVDQLPG
jgi:DNA-binding response OmpR family regulator